MKATTKTPQPNTERLYSVREAANRFDVSPACIHKWIRRGLFVGAYKKGPDQSSPYRIPESAIEAFAKRLKETIT